MRLIDSKTHGFLDYLGAALFLTAPVLFDFVGTPAERISVTTGTIYLGLTLLTAYPLGILKAVPFTVHGWIEVAMALTVLFMPWMADFAYAETARNFFVVAGAAIVALWVFSDYRETAPTRNWAAHHGLARG
jgi:hypothetical protein